MTMTDPNRADPNSRDAVRWRVLLTRLELHPDATVNDVLGRRDQQHSGVHVALRLLIDEAERVVLAEQQATGRTLTNLQWAIDAAHQVLAQPPT